MFTVGERVRPSEAVEAKRCLEQVVKRRGTERPNRALKGALRATLIVVAPIDTGVVAAALGYQMLSSSGLPSGSAAKPR